MILLTFLLVFSFYILSPPVVILRFYEIPSPLANTYRWRRRSFLHSIFFFLLDTLAKIRRPYVSHTLWNIISIPQNESVLLHVVKYWTGLSWLMTRNPHFALTQVYIEAKLKMLILINCIVLLCSALLCSALNLQLLLRKWERRIHFFWVLFMSHAKP